MRKFAIAMPPSFLRRPSASPRRIRNQKRPHPFHDVDQKIIIIQPGPQATLFPVIQRFDLVRIKPPILRQPGHCRKPHHQLLPHETLLRMVLARARHHQRESRRPRKVDRAQHQHREMRTRQLMPGGRRQVQMDDVAAIGMIRLLAHTSSLPTRSGISCSATLHALHSNFLAKRIGKRD